MPNGELQIEKDTFLKANSELRDEIIFDLLHDNNTRLVRLEKRKKVDTTFSVMAGGIGGFLAVIGKTLLGK